jgi:hypothetical protein
VVAAALSDRVLRYMIWRLNWCIGIDYGGIAGNVTEGAAEDEVEFDDEQKIVRLSY